MTQHTEGELIAKYLALRDKKKALEAAHEEAVRPYNIAMAQLENYFLTLLVERGLENLKSESGTVYKSTLLNVKMEDRNAVIRHAVGTGNFDIFTNSLSKDYVKEFIEQNHSPPPGVAVERFTKVNVRKS